MNKRLLLSLAIGLGATSSFALSVGDYVYTTDAKYKVVGQNLLSNGNFSNTFTGWSQLNGNAVDPECWSIATGEAADGSNAIQSLSNADGNDGTYIAASVPFEASKTYIITMKINTSTSFSTSVTPTSQNYVDVYANADGTFSKTASRFQQVATATAVKSGSWQEVSFAFTDTITGGSTGFIQVALGRLDPGTQVSNVEICEVNKVYDTRIAQRRIAYDKAILAVPEFTENRDELTGLVEALDGCLQANDGSALGLNLDDEAGMTDFLNQMKDLENQFLNANSYDLVANNIISSKALWNTKIQKGNGNYGDWFCSGSSRWFHDPSSDEAVRDYITSSYALNEGVLGIHKTLPAGKYMFQIEAKGLTYLSGKDESGNYTKPDYDTPVTNQLFICNDTLAADTLDHLNYQTYFIVADVPAATTADELNLIAGVKHQATVKGGTFYYRNPVLRYVSPTAEADITKFVADNNKATQQNTAKVMIDSANVVVAKAEYPWGKAQLKAGIDACTAVYDALVATESTTMLDKLADGVATGEQITVADSLMETMRDMRGYIEAYYGENLPYTNLVAAVNDAQSVISDPDNAKASASTRAALQTAIDNANAAIAVFAAQADSLAGDVEKSAALVAALNDASTNFRATSATFANPSEIALTNPDFASTTSGWDTAGSQTDNGRWKKAKNDAYDNGTALNVWRGYTAYSKNRAAQKVTLKQAGVYQFSCQAKAWNENGSRDGGVYMPTNCVYFVKVDAAADTLGVIQVHTPNVYVDSLAIGKETPDRFFITVVKTDDVETEYQVGFNAMDNLRCNSYGFSTNRIYYYGDADAFTTDLKTAANDELAEAEASLKAYEAQKDSIEYIRLRIAAANVKLALDGKYYQTPVGHDPSLEAAAKADTRATAGVADEAALMKAYRLLQIAKTNFDKTTTGIKGVVVNNDKVNVAKGVYNIAGQRVANSVKGLPAGLYIVNGKKVVVK